MTVAYPCHIWKDGDNWSWLFPDLGAAGITKGIKQCKASAEDGLRIWLSLGDNPAPSVPLEVAWRMGDFETEEILMIEVKE